MAGQSSVLRPFPLGRQTREQEKWRGGGGRGGPQNPQLAPSWRPHKPVTGPVLREAEGGCLNASSPGTKISPETLKLPQCRVGGRLWVLFCKNGCSGSHTPSLEGHT